MLLFCLLIYFFHDVDGVFAIYFFDVNFDNFLLGCWNIFSSEVWSNGKLTMPSVNEYAELYSLWPSKVKQGIQGSSHRSTCVNHVINENYDGVINAFRDYGLMDNGVRTRAERSSLYNVISSSPTGTWTPSMDWIAWASLFAKGIPRRRIPTNMRLSAPWFRSKISWPNVLVRASYHRRSWFGFFF